MVEGAAGGGDGGGLRSVAPQRCRLDLPAGATEAPGGGAAAAGRADPRGVAEVRDAGGGGRAEGPPPQQEAGERNSNSSSSSRISGSRGQGHDGDDDLLRRSCKTPKLFFLLSFFTVGCLLPCESISFFTVIFYGGEIKKLFCLQLLQLSSQQLNFCC